MKNFLFLIVSIGVVLLTFGATATLTAIGLMVAAMTETAPDALRPIGYIIALLLWSPVIILAVSFTRHRCTIQPR